MLPRARSRLLAVVGALVAALALTLLPAPAQADESTTPTDTPLVMAGVAGLQWSDVDAVRTPNLWRLIGGGSVASVSVRTLTPTCPLDAWLSVSAGSRTMAVPDDDATVDEGEQDEDGGLASLGDPRAAVGCTDMPVLPTATEPTSAHVPGWNGLAVDDPTAAQPGALGTLAHETGECTTAVGPGGAVALADDDGDVDRYLSDTDDLSAADVRSCPVTVVDLGELPDAATERTEALETLDAQVGELAALLPDGGRLVVAGISDTPNGPEDLQVVVDWTAPGGSATWLSSTSSRRTGVVVSADLSATLAQAITADSTTDPDAPDSSEDPDVDDEEADPAAAFSGAPLERGEDRRISVSRTVENRQYLSVLTEVLPLMTPVLIGIMAVAVVAVTSRLLVSRRRRDRPAPAPHRTRLALAVLVVAACLPVAATLATLSRWWVWDNPVTVLSVAVAVAALAVALAAWGVSRLLPPSRWRLPTALAATTWLVLTVDGVTGTTLQQGSLLGPPPSLGARFYGFSNSVFSVYAATGLIVAAGVVALLARRGASRRTQALVATGIGVVTILVDGLPPFGADLGGILALAPAFAVLVLGIASIGITWRRVLLIAGATVAVVAVVAVWDWAFPPATHLGGFVQSVLDGNAFAVLANKAAGAWATVANPAGAFAAVVCAATAWAVLDPDRARLPRLADAYADDPLLRRAVLSLVTVAGVGTALNDSGVVVAMYVLLTAVPILLVGSLDLSLAGSGPDGDAPARQRSTTGVLVGVTAGLLLALQVATAALPAGGLTQAGDVTDAGTPVLADGEPVVVVGTDGLRWEDVTPAATPTLWRLLRDGASAGGVTTSVTGSSGDCRSAGWLGLSSGRSSVTGQYDDGVWECAPWDVSDDAGDDDSGGEGATVTGWDELTTLQATSEYNPHLGVLGQTFADGGVCTTAVGPAAALTLAAPDGSVERYRSLPEALADPDDAFDCPLTVVDAGSAPYHPTGEGSDARPVPADATAPGDERDAALSAVDATVRQVLDAAGDEVTVLLLDVGNPTPTRPSLGTGLARTQAEAAPSYLTSAATRWLGVVRLLDLPPTLVEDFGLDRPADFAGSPYTFGDDRPGDAGTTVRDLAALTERDHALRTTTGAVTGFPTYVALIAFGLVVLVLPRVRRRRSPGVARAWTRCLDTVLLLCAAVPVASFLMTTWSWWRMPDPQVGLWGSLAAGTVLVALVGSLAPRVPAWAGPVLVSSVTFAVLSLDAVLGTPLHRGSPLGAAPTLGGRFYGFGNPTYSVYAVVAVLTAAGLATLVARRWNRVAAAVVAGAVGLVTLVVTVWPTFGVDVGGGLVLLPVFVVLVLAALGARLTWQRLLLAGGAGVLLVAAIGVLDWLRPADERSHLGAFVQSVLDGTAFETVWRKAGYALRSLDGGPPAWLSLAVVVAIVLALWGPQRWRPGWLARADAAWPMLRPVLIALLIAGVGGAVVNDYGIRVVTLMLFPAVPLIGLLVLRTDDTPSERSSG